jgi:hypothetical protein
MFTAHRTQNPERESSSLTEPTERIESCDSGSTAEARRSRRIKTFSLAADPATGGYPFRGTGTPASENLLTLRGRVYYASEFVAYLITLLRLRSRQTLANLERKPHAVAEPRFSFLCVFCASAVSQKLDPLCMT